MPGFVVQGFGAEGVDQKISGRQEYYYSYTWEIENLFETRFSGSSLINVRDASMPQFTVNKESYTGSSLEYKFAKSVLWEDIKVSWYDTVGLTDKIRTWRETVWTPDGGLKPANEYKKRSEIKKYLPNGESEESWRLYNCWPSGVKYGELTYTQSDIKFIEVTVTYDWAVEIGSSSTLAVTPAL